MIVYKNGEKIMIKKRVSLLHIILLIASIDLLIGSIIMYNLNSQVKFKGYGYYIGKIESMNQKDGITTMEVSPASSSREFVSEIKSNHQIEYSLDTVSIKGVKDPKVKNYKKVKMGELSEMIKNVKAGDTIIFKIKNNDYDKNEYNLQIDALAFDMTLE